MYIVLVLVGGPDVKVASKRPSESNVKRSRSTKSPEIKRKPTTSDTNKQGQPTVSTCYLLIHSLFW